MSDTTIEEILIPDDNCLKVPGEHCGSCSSDFEYSRYSDMNCCDHVEWQKETAKALNEHALKTALEIIDQQDPQTGKQTGKTYWGNTLRESFQNHYRSKHE